MNEFADNILGYGSKRFIEVFFRGFKNDSWGFSSTQPAKAISVFGATEGRLSIMQPNSQQSTKVATKKSVVTIFLDIEEAEANGEDAKCGKFEDKWGSNYWLTLIYNKLKNVYNEEN